MRVRWKKKRRSPAAAFPALAGLILAAGCASPSRFIAEGFEQPPKAWSAFQEEDRWGPAPIQPARDWKEVPPEGAAVLNGRLLAGGKQIYRAEFTFQKFHGTCEFSVAGGILDGSAGIFVEDLRSGPDGSSRPFYFTLALNGRGAWLAYRGFPGRPLGVYSWRPLPDPNPAVPHLLGAEASSGTVRFLVDGRQVASFGGPGPAREAPGKRGAPKDAAAGATPRMRVGAFTEHLRASFDDFIFGEDGPEGPFRPADHPLPGGAGDGERLIEEAAARAGAFRKKPSRSGLLEVIEARSAVERAFHREKDDSRAETEAAGTVKVMVSLDEAARQARSEDLLRMVAQGRRLQGEAREALVGKQGEAFAKRARAASSAGRPTEALIFWLAAGEIESTPETEREAEKLLASLVPGLSLQYVARQESATSDEFPRQMFYSAVRSIYGALPEGKDAEIRIEVAVKEAKVSQEVEESQRKVPRSVSGNPMPTAVRSELKRLEKSFPEDLRDAGARAKLARIVDLDGRARFERVEIDGRSLEFLIEDARVLRRNAARLEELRSRKEAEKATEREFLGIPAKLHTDSARVRLTYRLTYPGGVEVADAIEVYEAIEQWTHSADPSRRIEAATWSKVERDRMVASVRERSLARLRTGIARERILEKLGRDEATRFIFRFARSSREEEDRAVAEWRLKSTYGLEGITLERVLRRLLEPAREVS